MILNMTARIAPGAGDGRRATLPLLLGAVCVVIVLAMSTSAAAIEPDNGPDTAESDVDVEYEYDYAADTEAGTLDEFKDELSPHGAWVDDPTYGTVWVPDAVVVGKDFQPYRSAGRWGVTDDGDWVWLSDYDWGYIPFHYGRWVWIPARGWSWIPGRVYAPAWVVWRTGEPGYDYIGWAPAPPAYVWFNGFAVGYYSSLTMAWWYCPSAYFFHPHWHSYWVTHPGMIRRIHSHTHVHHHYHGSRHRPSSARRPAQGTASKGGHNKAGGNGHKPASNKPAAKKTATKKTANSAGGSYAKNGIPKSPSFEAARVPKSAIPAQRAKPNDKALALRKPFPSKTPATKAGSPAAKGKSLQGKRSPGYSPKGGAVTGRATNGGYRYGQPSKSTAFPKARPGTRPGKLSSPSTRPSYTYRYGNQASPAAKRSPAYRSGPSYSPSRQHSPSRQYSPSRKYSPSPKYSPSKSRATRPSSRSSHRASPSKSRSVSRSRPSPSRSSSKPSSSRGRSSSKSRR